MYELARHTLSQRLVAAVRASLNDRQSPEAEIANEIISSLATGVPLGEKRRIVIEDERQLQAIAHSPAQEQIAQHPVGGDADFLVTGIPDYLITAEYGHPETETGPSAPANRQIEKIIFTREFSAGDKFEVEIQHSAALNVCIVILKVLSISDIKAEPPPELARKKKYPVGYDDERMKLLHEYLEKGYPLKSAAANAVKVLPSGVCVPESDVTRLTRLYKDRLRTASRPVPIPPPMSSDNFENP